MDTTGRGSPIDPAAVGLLARAVGVDLELYRPEHVEERVRRALERTRTRDAAALAALAALDPRVRAKVRRAVAVPVTGERRDPHQFDLLEQLLPELVGGRPRVAVWSAGCADGSELLDVALLLERAGALDRSLLLGSDMLEENIAAARARTDVPHDVLSRLRFDVRRLPTDGAPQGRFEIVLCRNLAIYLTVHARDRLHTVLADALAPGGVLLLGRSERIADAARLGLDRIDSYAYRRRA